MQDIFLHINRSNHLIRIRGTGTPSQPASRAGVGERTIYEYISIMKDLGAPIRFCRSRRHYCHDREGEFTISFISYEPAD